jgi:hypothetical protein
VKQNKWKWNKPKNKANRNEVQQRNKTNRNEIQQRNKANRNEVQQRNKANRNIEKTLIVFSHVEQPTKSKIILGRENGEISAYSR